MNVLLNHGAHPSIVNNDGRTEFDDAGRHNKEEPIRPLHQY